MVEQSSVVAVVGELLGDPDLREQVGRAAGWRGRSGGLQVRVPRWAVALAVPMSERSMGAVVGGRVVGGVVSGSIGADSSADVAVPVSSGVRGSAGTIRQIAVRIPANTSAGVRVEPRSCNAHSHTGTGSANTHTTICTGSRCWRK